MNASDDIRCTTSTSCRGRRARGRGKGLLGTLTLTAFLGLAASPAQAINFPSPDPDPEPDPDPPADTSVPEPGEFMTFESGQVRPLELSADGSRLYATNTPDNRVEVYDVTSGTPQHIESISVGLEPVAVADAGNGQIWVVNHLSDSVSVVDVSESPARVVNTLLVGDEPRDIVFAGPNNKWAFITAAHRGQNSPYGPQELNREGIGRADVWVFDKNNLGTELGGEEVTILNMFGDTLRGLAKSPDGSEVYTAVFNSGNKTSTVTDDLELGGLDKPGPYTSSDGIEAPLTGINVKWDGSNWVGPGNPVEGTEPKVWNDMMNLELPDNDVFTIDASGNVPRVTGSVSGVGTTLFNLAVNPTNGNIYVSNQEANNLTRFEGPGTRSTTVNGDFVKSRVTVVDGNNVEPRHLNKHITSYDEPLGTQSEKERAVAIPLQLAISSDGSEAYLATLGTSKLVKYDTAALENDSFQPSTSNQVELSGGGATGVVLDEERNRAYVLTRFDNGISVVDTSNLSETAHVQMFNPEPEHVVEGRPFLYDTTFSSSRGDSSCAGCHIFGDMDHLAWDLGNPDGTVKENPNEYNSNIPAFGRNLQFHPMKGPMMTQSMRGLEGAGPMHWRGDRTGQSAGPNESLTEQAFKDFNVAFVDLLGRAEEIPEEDMDKFTEFALELMYPPNPIRNLDNSLTSRQQQGRELYFNQNSDGIAVCNDCHVVDEEQGFFGTDFTMSIEGAGVVEDMKIPHLRNAYQKVGMFADNSKEEGVDENLGPQIRGFGFDHQGSSGEVSTFLASPTFLFNAEERALVQDFVYAMDSDLKPIVGQQVTVTQAGAAQSDVNNRLDLMVERAEVGECELVAKSVVEERRAGWVFNEGTFIPDTTSDSGTSLSELLAQTAEAGTPVTFTCVPPGNGTRIGVDRDLDDVRDGDEA